MLPCCSPSPWKGVDFQAAGTAIPFANERQSDEYAVGRDSAYYSIPDSEWHEVEIGLTARLAGD
jgi:hypothetical protein